MEAKILSIYSADVDLETYEPHNDQFWFELTIEVSIDGYGSSNFSTQVYSYGRIENELEHGGVFTIGKSIIVHDYSIDKLKRYIERIVQEANALNPNSWEDLANKLWALGDWEFKGLTEKS